MVYAKSMKVIATQQGYHGTVSDQTWADDTDEVGAMLAVAQLMQHAKDDSPWAPRILEIRIEL
jgi:hypothetical protein